MKYERITGMVLIATGVLAMASWLGWAGWLWLAALAAFFLYMYVRQDSYPFLVVGAIVAGLAVGSLLGGGGAMLVSLGAGFFAIDRIEPRRSRWPLYLGGVLAALGFLVWLLGSGLLGSVVFAALLIALGLLLLLRGEGEGSGRWTYVEPPPKEPTPSAPAPATPTTPVKPAATPGEAEASPESEVVKNAVQGRVEEDGGENPREGSSVGEPPLSDEEAGRYRRLEAWRKAKAIREGKPAYIILTNESLARIAREKPQTLAALKEIKGIGPVKLERFGEEILAVLQTGAPGRQGP